VVLWNNLVKKYSRKPRQDSRGCSIDRSRESGGEIGKADSEGRIVKAETREVVYRRDIADAAAILPAHSSGDVDLLFK